MKKTIKIYSISRGYRKVSIWEGDPKTGQRIHSFSSRAMVGLDRKQRYENVKRCLTELGIKAPSYKEHEK